MYYLILLSLILINLEKVNFFRKFSPFFSITGSLLLLSVLVYLVFNSKTYFIGIIMIGLVVILIGFEKSEKYSDYKLWFLLAELVVVILGFSVNFISGI